MYTRLGRPARREPVNRPIGDRVAPVRRSTVIVDPIIQLPPLSSSRRGPPQQLVRPPEGRPRSCDMHPSRGGYQRPVTPTKDGYRPRLTPGNLKKSLSQGPIIHRPHHDRVATGHLGFRLLTRSEGSECADTEPLPRSESSNDRSFLGE